MSFLPFTSSRHNWRFDKIGDSGTKRVIWEYCWCTTYSAPRISGRNNEAGKIIVWAPRPLHILQIHSLHQVATVSLSHVPLQCRGIIIAIFRGSGTNCMVPSYWDLAPKCVCSPNFISDLIGDSLILSTASVQRNRAKFYLIEQKNKFYLIEQKILRFFFLLSTENRWQILV